MKIKRRNTFALAIVVLILAVGGAVALVNAVRATTSVLIVARPIAQGHVITAEDLRSTTLNADAKIPTILASAKASTVGRKVTTALPAGSILSPDELTDTVIPASGQAVVGVTVTPAQMPSEQLVPGDKIRVVDTPGDNGAANTPATTGSGSSSPAAAGTPAASAATVIGTRTLTETGQVSVDVLVNTADAASLAARVSTKRVAIVLDSRER